VIYDDANVRIWNFTLSPGEMTSMHSHDHDYYFVAIQPTQLEVWGEDGSRLFDFRAEGTLGKNVWLCLCIVDIVLMKNHWAGFRVEGDFLVPTNVELPFPVPRVHAAKNIGPTPYYELLFETKKKVGSAGEL
jgi:hypothetical protein